MKASTITSGDSAAFTKTQSRLWYFFIETKIKRNCDEKRTNLNFVMCSTAASEENSTRKYEKAHVHDLNRSIYKFMCFVT